MIRKVMLAGAAALTLAACERPNATTNDSELAEGAAGVGAAVEDAAGGAVGLASANLPKTATEFVQAAAISNMYEIEAAQMALQRAQNPRTKEFAQTMVNDHTAMTESLQSAIPGTGLSIAMPTELDARRQEMIDNLRGVSDQDFDDRYLEQQEMAHQEALALMRGYADGGDNAALQALASTAAPKIDQHLTMAREIENALDETGSTAQ